MLFLEKNFQKLQVAKMWNWKDDFVLRTVSLFNNPRKHVRLSPTMGTQIQDPFHVWVMLQANVSIPIFCLLQQQDPKENPFCKWVSRREDTQIWVIPLLIPKMDLPYKYSVGSYRYSVGDLFWVWVSCWRQPLWFCIKTCQLLCQPNI